MKDRCHTLSTHQPANSTGKKKKVLKDFKQGNSKRRSKESIGLTLVEDSDLTNRDEEKAETFIAVFASVFNTDRRIARPRLQEQ